MNKFRQKNDYEAIIDFSKAIELNPNHTDAYGERARSYMNLRNFKKALADWHRVVELGQ